MTKGPNAKPAKANDSASTLVIRGLKDETESQSKARALFEPPARHGLTAALFTGKMMGASVEMPGINETAGYVQGEGSKAVAGDLAIASRLLSAQAITLDNMFTEFARRAGMNMAEYIQAAESYARLAMKAQGNCRATLETLAKLHQPREQTVRHVHINEGGQAIVADQFHNHPGGQKADPFEQSHATGEIGQGAPMLCPDPQGNALSVTGGEGQGPMQDARGDKSWSA